MMTREEVVAYYCQQTGQRVTYGEWAWYEVFGVFRVAVIAQQVYQRYLAKQTTNKQFRFFGVAVLMLELRCRRIVARTKRMSPERADAPVGAES
jgi:aminoglycoside phosphotransferase (APT) family kinase protein